jgi:hypothetical protein
LKSSTDLTAAVESCTSVTIASSRDSAPAVTKGDTERKELSQIVYRTIQPVHQIFHKASKFFNIHFSIAIGIECVNIDRIAA